MSMLGNGSGYLWTSQRVPFTGQTGVITAWVFRSNSGAGGAAVSMGQTANANAIAALTFGAADPIFTCQTRIVNNAGGNQSPTTTLDATMNNNWMLFIAQFQTTSARDNFCFGRHNGFIQSAANANASGTTAAWTQIAIGAELTTSAANIMTSGMRIAHVSFWDYVPRFNPTYHPLSQGVHPLFVKGPPPVLHFPLIGDAFCQRTGLELTKAGATPNIFDPGFNPTLLTYETQRPKRIVQRFNSSPPAPFQRVNRTVMYS